MGNLSGAEKDLTRALALAPSAPAYLASLAHCRLLQGNAGEALQILDQALLNEYRHPLVFLLRAKSLVQLGQQEAARSVLVEMLAISPSYPEAWRLLSMVAYDMEDYTQSESAADRALALGWKRGEALWLRGRARMMLARTEEGCRDLNAASLLGWEEAGVDWQEKCGTP
jgi:predicted Zn-dependent protease